MSSLRVLVVEDDEALGQLLQYNLTREGYSVILAIDGEAALAKAFKQAPDVVILDWMLPRLSGLEVCQRLRAHETTRRTPILMLTAHVHETDPELGLDSGADDYMVKPVSMRELFARIRAVLRRVGALDP